MKDKKTLLGDFSLGSFILQYLLSPHFLHSLMSFQNANCRYIERASVPSAFYFRLIVCVFILFSSISVFSGFMRVYVLILSTTTRHRLPFLFKKGRDMTSEAHKTVFRLNYFNLARSMKEGSRWLASNNALKWRGNDTHTARKHNVKQPSGYFFYFFFG